MKKFFFTLALAALFTPAVFAQQPTGGSKESAGVTRFEQPQQMTDIQHAMQKKLHRRQWLHTHCSVCMRKANPVRAAKRKRRMTR